MAARIICRCGPRDHVTPLRKELHWLPIEARPVFKILCYTYKAIHGNLPDYMCDLARQCSLFTTPSDVASDRETLVSRDYAQSRQILLNMDTCVIVLLHPLYGTRYQRTFGQLRHLLLSKSY